MKTIRPLQSFSFHDKCLCQRRSDYSGRNGFSLIELLVVVALVAILASLLMTRFKDMRARAMDSGAHLNMRQLMMGEFSYAADNQNCFTQPHNVTGIAWQMSLAPYVLGRTVTNTELNVLRQDPKSVFNVPNSKPSSARKISACSLALSAKAPVKMLAIAMPAQIILFGECEEANSDTYNSSDGSSPRPAYRRIGNKAAVMLCDGHMEDLTAEELVLNPKGGTSRWK